MRAGDAEREQMSMKLYVVEVDVDDRPDDCVPPCVPCVPQQRLFLFCLDAPLWAVPLRAACPHPGRYRYLGISSDSAALK